MLALQVGAGAADAQPLTDCRIAGLRNSVKCGVVQRALDPARPDGPKIDVRYVVVPAMARRKLPDPVFLIAGGPGQSAIDVAPQVMPLFGRLNNRRDIVFVDQRGTGQSAPLDCPESRRELLAEQADAEAQIAQVMECKAGLLKKPYIRAPADLGFFTTTIAMQDLDAVRRQLGAAQIDLVGVSYGTRAVLEYMRQHPAAVRRAVLDSVAPPDMILPTSFSTDGQAAFEALLVACEKEPECARTYPRLRAEWIALLASLPKPATAPHPLSGAHERFTLTREMLLTAVRGAL
ncbi:MAG: alpha/beta hydrolase, partial [Rhizobiales bacterium]|nr:alpha/beta hydrolase [Rhizobacter sp.]